MKAKFEDIIEDGRPVIVDFHALWCGPCKVQSPILQQIAAEYGDTVKVIKIDVDQNQLLASRYKIQGVPTIMVFKKGELLWRQSGVASKLQIEDIIKKHITKG